MPPALRRPVHDENNRLSLDPCGLLCLSLSYGLHLFALVASGLVLIPRHALAQSLYGALYVPLSVLALWSLTMAATTDPGSVPMGARPLPSNLAAGEGEGVAVERDVARGGLRRRRGVRRCGKCDDNYKPGRAHHDSVTGRCIVKMDHFCPWVGNAVGIMNHKVSSSTVDRRALLAPSFVGHRYHHYLHVFALFECSLISPSFFVSFILACSSSSCSSCTLS